MVGIWEEYGRALMPPINICLLMCPLTKQPVLPSVGWWGGLLAIIIICPLDWWGGLLPVLAIHLLAGQVAHHPLSFIHWAGKVAMLLLLFGWWLGVVKGSSLVDVRVVVGSSHVNGATLAQTWPHGPCIATGYINTHQTHLSMTDLSHFFIVST